MVNFSRNKQMYGVTIGSDIHHLQPSKPIAVGHPLHVTNFFRTPERVHVKTQTARQNLILYLYDIWKSATATRYPAGFLRIPMSLVALRSAVYDYRPALDFFFEVADTGYNFNDGLVAEISVVTPKEINHPFFTHQDRQTHSVEVVYVPPQKPISDTFSTCIVQGHDLEKLVSKLKEERLFHLIPPIKWLYSLENRTIKVYFEPTGKLQQRDMSVWPIRGMEMWPSWLRETVFGPGVDIEAAYNQFIVGMLLEHAPTPTFVSLVYPDLIAQFNDKQAWRENLCRDIGFEVNETNIKVIKTLVMALANGSNISGKIMNAFSSFSQARDLLEVPLENATLEERERVGERLGRIAKQFRDARKVVGSYLGNGGKREMSKCVFPAYFSWEREKRYEIWEKIGRYGLMTHDGIDGIPPEVLAKKWQELQELDIKVA